MSTPHLNSPIIGRQCCMYETDLSRSHDTLFYVIGTACNGVSLKVDRLVAELELVTAPVNGR